MVLEERSAWCAQASSWAFPLPSRASVRGKPGAGLAVKVALPIGIAGAIMIATALLAATCPRAAPRACSRWTRYAAAHRPSHGRTTHTRR